MVYLVFDSQDILKGVSHDEEQVAEIASALLDLGSFPVKLEVYPDSAFGIVN